MDNVLRGLDILVSSSSEEEHLQDLRTLFQRLSEHGLLINPVKCVFQKKEVDFLSHSISAEGIRPNITRI